VSKRVIAIAVVFGIALGAIAALALALRTTPDPRIAEPSRPAAPNDAGVVVAEVHVDVAPADAAPSDPPSAPKTPVSKTPVPKTPVSKTPVTKLPVPAPSPPPPSPTPSPTTPSPTTPSPTTPPPTAPDPTARTTPDPTVPAPTTTTPPPGPPLSPQQRNDKARKLRNDGDLAFMVKDRVAEALQLFMQAYDLVPDAENTLRVARWYYIAKQYAVAWQWAKRAKASHPTPGQGEFEVKQLMNWIRQELLVRGLPID
jgi:hypothetical protein